MGLPYFHPRFGTTWCGASPRTIATATLGALLFAAAACRDAVTGPPASRADVERTNDATPSRWAPKPDDEDVTITRTTETFDRRDGRLVLRDRRVKRSMVGRTVTSARNGSPARSAAADADAPDASNFPPIGLTMEASRRASSPGLAWRNRHPLAGVPGVEVEVEGVGDAPASVLRYYERGSLTRTVTQAYRLRRGRWELTRRETTTPDGSLRDVLVVEHEAGEAAATNVFRSTTEADPWLGDPFAFRPLTQFDEECDPCKALRQAKEAAFESFLFQDAAAILICLLTPPPADVLACTGAALKVAEAYRKFERADEAYDQCMANPPKCPDDETDTSGGGGGGGGGDGGDGESGGGLHCYWEVWYDPETGRVLSSELLYCEQD